MERRPKYDLKTFRGKGSRRPIPAGKIVAWIAKHFDYKERKGGEEILICNPFSADTGYKFNINPEKETCHCWTGDEWAGKINPETGKRNCSFTNFVKLYRNLTYIEAMKEILGTTEDIRSYLRPENRHSTAEPVLKVAVALPDGAERLADNQDDRQAKIILNWLGKRGYDLAEVDRYDLHYLAMECYWPYYEFDTLVYWQSRSRLNKVYRFPDLVVYDKKGNVTGETDGGKGDFLYGFDDCQYANYLTITESIFGKHTLGEQALASGGAILTARQIDKIRVLGPRKGVILAPDNDEAGIKSIISNIALLRGEGFPLFYSVPPKVPFEKDGVTKYTKDWNEMLEELKMSKAEVRELHDKRIKKVTAITLSDLYRLLG